MTILQKRIIELSYKNKLSHIGSCLGLVDILDRIYTNKNPEDKVVISNGHAHLAHLVVREKHEGIDAQDYIKYGVHCDREAGCDVSTGSLGQGISIAVGLALADRGNTIYCTTSDGESNEGSFWEALRIASDQKLLNLHIYLIANGYTAYDSMNIDLLERRLKGFYPVTIVRVNTDLPFAKGLEPHYKVLNEDEYKSLN
jgi:transketolase